MVLAILDIIPSLTGNDIYFLTMKKRFQHLLPWFLVGSRFALAPVAVYLAVTGAPSWLWMTQFFLAALSDWLDGKLARAWGTVTANLRQADSIADTVYALGILSSLWFAHREVVVDHLWGIIAVIVIEGLRYPLDWYRFGRGASYHALSAKVFGVALLVSVTAIMGFGYVGPLLWVTLLIGVISELEGVAISLLLPEWTHDVRHVGKALEIRRSKNQK